MSTGAGRMILELGYVSRPRLVRTENLRWINHAISTQSVTRILGKEASIVEFDRRSQST
jgi:hypothetical protein